MSVSGQHFKLNWSPPTTFEDGSMLPIVYDLSYKIHIAPLGNVDSQWNEVDVVDGNNPFDLSFDFSEQITGFKVYLTCFLTDHPHLESDPSEILYYHLNLDNVFFGSVNREWSMERTHNGIQLIMERFVK